MRSSSEAKRAAIIDAARALFVERGYDGATVQMIAQRAKAAVGSVTHLVGRKPTIAAGIYEALVADLVHAVRRSIGAGALGHSAPRIIEACMEWLEADPARLPLLDDLDQALRREAIPGHQPVGARLGDMLTQYGKASAARTGGLGGSELYALILAPVLERMRLRDVAGTEPHARRRRWIGCLAAAATAGLETVGRGAGPRSQRQVDDLFGDDDRGADGQPVSRAGTSG